MSISHVDPLQHLHSILIPPYISQELGTLAEVPQEEGAEAQRECHDEGQEAPGSVHDAEEVVSEVQLHYEVGGYWKKEFIK